MASQQHRLKVPISSNINSKSREFKEGPIYRITLSQALEIEKVQRLFRKEVHSSEWKRETSLMDDDIV